MKKNLFMVCAAAASMLLALLPCHAQEGSTPEERAEALLRQLSVEEKTGLLIYDSSPVERLGIGAYNWWNEALHGVARNGSATVFPQPIGMAASFDPVLLEEVFSTVSDEARVKNRIARENNDVHIYNGVTFWTPNINIFRDPRWGRGMETYGEDPYLTGVLGCTVVRGLQGDVSADVLKTHACAKHFAVHSGPESSRHSIDVNVSERDLRETYLPAFKDLVTKADVQEVMTAYNRFEGEPCAASGRLVKDILRGEWGYKGLVVTDCWALSDFYVPGRHGFASSAAEAAAFAIKNGVDIECGDTFRAVPEAVRLGLITEDDIDKCLFRQLVQRFRLGEMDGVSPWDSLSFEIVESPEHRDLALRMAWETIVLLQNKGNVLPIPADEKTALIGPNADDEEMMWGNYNPVPNSTVTLLEAMRQRCPELVYFKGCGHVGGSGLEKEGAELDPEEVLDRLEGVETVIFAGGISPRLEGEEMPVAVEGFSGGDRTSIELPSLQRRMLKILHDAGKKVIFVNFSGSAIALAPETESCDAIVQAWYPGQEGGTALADVLYGEVNPSGKLPVTFYSSDAQLPDFDNYDMEGRTYRYFKGEPLFDFGYGLSYTRFKYGRARVKKGAVTFKVKNVGKRDGDEVVQLYVSRPDDPQGPVRTLKAFRRCSIRAGQSVRVTIPLDDEVFQWWDPSAQDMRPLTGSYRLWYGSSSQKKDLRTLKYRFKS